MMHFDAIAESLKQTRIGYTLPQNLYVSEEAYRFDTEVMLKSVWLPAKAEAYLDSFDLLSNTYLKAVTWEPATALEARTCDLLAGMLLARVDGKSPVEYLREDWQHALIRQQTIAWLNQPQAKLADMRAQWKTA